MLLLPFKTNDPDATGYVTSNKKMRGANSKCEKNDTPFDNDPGDKGQMARREGGGAWLQGLTAAHPPGGLVASMGGAEPTSSPHRRGGPSQAHGLDFVLWSPRL